MNINKKIMTLKKYKVLNTLQLKKIMGGEDYCLNGITPDVPPLNSNKRKNDFGIYSCKSGRVVEVKYSNKGFGNYIKIRDKDGNIAIYAHLSHINVTKGMYVDMNDEIGIMGNTGNSTGTHLHFEVRDKNGKLINPLKYMQNGVRPTNTQISGGYEAIYDFEKLTSLWYIHPAIDFSGKNIISNRGHLLKGSVNYEKEGSWQFSLFENPDLYQGNFGMRERTLAYQQLEFQKLRSEWKNLGGKDNLKETLDGVDEKIKGIENNITKGKNKLSEIEDSITKTEDILVPSFIKKKILTNLQKELNKAKKELDDLEDLLRSEKKEKEDFKTLAGQLERAGSVEFAKKIDKLNDAKTYRDKLKDEFEKALKENEEIQKNPAFSNDYKAKYADYVNNIKAALEKAETNTNIIESNLTKYITGKKEEELLVISEPKKPDLAGSTNTATGQTSQTSSSTTTTDTNTGNNNSDSSSEKDTDPEPWLSNPKPTKKNDKKNDGGNNPPPPKNNPPPKKGGGGGGSKPKPPSPPGGGGGSRTIYTPSSIDTNNEYYLGSLYGTKPFSAQESSAFNSTIISNELSALQPITSLNVAGLPVNDTAIKEDPFGV